MTNYADGHHDAMKALDRAEAARRQGDEEKARAAMLRALQLETRAAENAPSGLEPTRSVLFRSAASIAADLGDTLEAKRLVLEGLRGRPPEEIKAELFEILDEIGRTAIPSAVDGAVIQQLRIFRPPTKRRTGALTLSLVSEIQRRWINAIDGLTDGPSEFVPVDAGVGSFIVRFEIRRDDDEFAEVFAALEELRDLEQMLASPGFDVGTSQQQLKRFEGVRRVFEVAISLAEFDVHLEVTTHGTPDDEPTTFTLRPPSRNVLTRIQKMVSRHIASIDVPQADDLEKVFRFVDIVAKGGYPTPESLEVVKRQVNYYRRAAEILGYLAEGRLAPGGRLLARLPESRRWADALARFSAAEIGSAWIEWNDVSDLLALDPASAEDFLREVAVGLSDDTIKRRAKTLASWRKRLADELS